MFSNQHFKPWEMEHSAAGAEGPSVAPGPSYPMPKLSDHLEDEAPNEMKRTESVVSEYSIHTQAECVEHFTNPSPFIRHVETIRKFQSTGCKLREREFELWTGNLLEGTEPMLTWKGPHGIFSRRHEVPLRDVTDWWVTGHRRASMGGGKVRSCFGMQLPLYGTEPKRSTIGWPPKIPGLPGRSITIVSIERWIGLVFEDTQKMREWASYFNYILRTFDQGKGTVTFKKNCRYDYTYAISSRVGSYGLGEPERDNQDAAAVYQCFGGNPEAFFTGVYDGHGVNGRNVALFVRNTLPKLFLKHVRKAQSRHQEPNIHNCFKQAFRGVDRRLRQQSKINLEYSGTTATVVYVCGAEVTVANVGDSRALFGVWDPVTKTVLPQDLSRDHRLSPSLPHFREERLRIEQSGGMVKSNETDQATNRIFFSDGTGPGLAVSRALGDGVAKTCGVTADPYVHTSTIDENIRMLVVASDGVWEFMSSHEVIEFVSRYSDPTEAGEALTTHAQTIFERETQRTDDTTVVVYYFSGVNLPRRTSPSVATRTPSFRTPSPKLGGARPSRSSPLAPQPIAKIGSKVEGSGG